MLWTDIYLYRVCAKVYQIWAPSKYIKENIGDRAVETSEGQFIGNDDVRIWLFFTCNFIDVDTFYLFWIDLVRVLATTRNTFAVAGYTRV